MKPLCIDLFCGLGGWAEGFLAAGYDVVGFDIERHVYGEQKYPAQLVLQDVLTIHGSQFKDAACIVASPPCQQYSWLAMPWSRSKDPNNSKAAKALRHKWETEGPDNRLFDACFRIQREACEAAGRYIPLTVENVRGAIPWVGRSAWNYGSFHLWGDVPALMPINLRRGQKVPGFRFDGSGRSFQTASVEVTGTKGLTVALDEQRDVPVGTGNGSWFFGKGRKDPRDIRQNEAGEWVALDGTKIGGDWFSDPKSTCRKHGSRSKARKAASAQIAKIPFPLAEHIAQVFKPRVTEKVA